MSSQLLPLAHPVPFPPDWTGERCSVRLPSCSPLLNPIPFPPPAPAPLQSRNPFVDRTAEKTELDDVSLYVHSDLQGFRPSGERRSGGARTRRACALMAASAAHPGSCPRLAVTSLAGSLHPRRRPTARRDHLHFLWQARQRQDHDPHADAARVPGAQRRGARLRAHAGPLYGRPGAARWATWVVARRGVCNVEAR